MVIPVPITPALTLREAEAGHSFLVAGGVLSSARNLPPAIVNEEMGDDGRRMGTKRRAALGVIMRVTLADGELMVAANWRASWLTRSAGCDAGAERDLHHRRNAMKKKASLYCGVDRKHIEIGSFGDAIEKNPLAFAKQSVWKDVNNSVSYRLWGLIRFLLEAAFVIPMQMPVGDADWQNRCLHRPLRLCGSDFLGG